MDDHFVLTNHDFGEPTAVLTMQMRLLGRFDLDLVRYCHEPAEICMDRSRIEQCEQDQQSVATDALKWISSLPLRRKDFLQTSKMFAAYDCVWINNHNALPLYQGRFPRDRRAYWDNAHEGLLYLGTAHVRQSFLQRFEAGQIRWEGSTDGP